MPPRRSGPLTSETHSNPGIISGERTRKKQQTHHHADLPNIKKRGRGGRLKKLIEMPLDILFEIFGELNPLDVLNLARSSKSLRDILLRPSAVSIWKKALSNVPGLPDCPSDISEPLYTNLAFDRHCHVCSANTQDVYWEYRIRCCTNCFSGKFSPDPLCRKTGATRYLAYDLLPVINVKIQSRMAHPRLNKEALCLFERLENMQNDKTRLNQFVEEQRLHAKQVKAHAKLCYTWQHQTSQQRALELDDVRKRRKEAIVAKLTDLGWGEEIDLERGSYRRRRTLLINHPLVRQPKELTERIWNNIKPTLVEFMTNKRDARLHKDWEVQVSKRIQMVIHVVEAFIRPRYTNQWLPNAVDFCLIEEFRALIMDPSPDDSTITEANFKALEPCIPEAVNKWRLSQDRLLLEMLPEAENGPAGDTTDRGDDGSTRLDLATTFFSCKTCLGRDKVYPIKNKSAKKKMPHPIGYPRILTHSCLNDNPSPFSDDDPNSEILSKLAFRRKQPLNLRGDQVRFHTLASTIACNVVTACGKDPAVTTASNMDQHDVRLECGRCSKGTNSRLVMTWRMAICHSIDCHSEKKGGSRSWKMLDGDDAQKAKTPRLEAGEHQLYKHFSCTWCNV